MILNTKQKSESLLRSLRDQQGKVETLSEDLQVYKYVSISHDFVPELDKAMLDPSNEIKTTEILNFNKQII